MKQRPLLRFFSLAALLTGACVPTAPQPVTPTGQPSSSATALSPPPTVVAAVPAGPEATTELWHGTWERRTSRFAPSSLAIRPSGPGKVAFKFDASTGANTGALEGVAQVDVDSAVYRQGACEMTLVKKQDSIEVRGTQCDDALGAGVTLEGTYRVAGTISKYSTSFDCAAASHAIETLICRDWLLAAADVALADAHGKARARAQGVRGAPDMKAVGEVDRTRVTWLEQRDRCSSASEPRMCLLSEYRKRLLTLRDGPKATGVLDLASLRTSAEKRDADGIWGDLVLQLYLAEHLGAQYESLLNQMMLVTSVEDPKAAVVEGCVRGICPSNKGYVAIDTKRGAVWAALFPGDDAGLQVIVFEPRRGVEPPSLKPWLAGLNAKKIERRKTFK